MEQQKMQSSSKFIDIFDEKIGMSIEDSTEEDFQELSDEECCDLAFALDRTLAAERDTIQRHPSVVMPLPYSEYHEEWFKFDQASLRLTLLHPQVVVPISNVEKLVWEIPRGISKHTVDKRNTVDKQP